MQPLPAVPGGPRGRTNQARLITPLPAGRSFGGLDYAMLVASLAVMVGVGVSFMSKMKETDEFFRGGQQVQWWAAGCSIFATMRPGAELFQRHLRSGRRAAVHDHA